MSSIKRADHGENFVPGSEDAPNLAPQPLDHFKRGYRERANQRERDLHNHDVVGGNTVSTANDSNLENNSDQYDGRSQYSSKDVGNTGRSQIKSRFSSNGGDNQSFIGGDHRNGGMANQNSIFGGSNCDNGDDYRNHNSSSRYDGSGRGREGRGHAGRDSSYPHHIDSGPYFRRGRGNPRHYLHVDHDDRWGGRGGQQIIMGLDIKALVDRLVRPGCDVFRELGISRSDNMAVFQSGKAVTAIISNLARRRNLRIAITVWDWIDHVGIEKNTFHYNSMISACEKVRDYNKALRLLDEMKEKNVAKNEVTFSSAISACEKCGQWRTALDLLEQMKKEGAGQTAIAYNAAISACEKGLVPHKALEIFEQMKREGVQPTVVTFSALISAAEKGQQWKLALEVLEEMKAAGHGANVIAYSAAISALSKGQMWHKALELFREIEASGGKPSIVTYNATMTALEKGLQWERALDLFDEMKSKNMPVTVVSYGSAISACEKGLQYRQCLEYLDEMTELGIKKNVIIFGAAMSCMEKSCRADIGFQLMERMRLENVSPNVHIYNSAISACARCNLWEKGYELFEEMDRIEVAKDVVTYNAVLDAVSSQVELGRRLFKEGVEKGFYARVSRLGTQWLELDLHFLSLGGGEIALGWWFEECLLPNLYNTSKLEAVQSISIVTGYGKTRSRGARLNNDGMRLRVRAMLKYMDIRETPQPNKGRIHIDKSALIDVVKKNGGRIQFDLEGYTRFKEKETTANKFPDVVQQVRPRFRPALPGQGPPGSFIRDGDIVPSIILPGNEGLDTIMKASLGRGNMNDNIEYTNYLENSRFSTLRNSRENRLADGSLASDRRLDDRMHVEGKRGGSRDSQTHAIDDDQGGHGKRRYLGNYTNSEIHRRGVKRDFNESRSGPGSESERRGQRYQESYEGRKINSNWDGGNNIKSDRDSHPTGRESGNVDKHWRIHDHYSRSLMARSYDAFPANQSDRCNVFDNRSDTHSSRRTTNQHDHISNFNLDAGRRKGQNYAGLRPIKRNHGFQDSNNFKKQRSLIRGYDIEPSYKIVNPKNSAEKKRHYDKFESRGYDIEPAHSKHRGNF